MSVFPLISSDKLVRVCEWKRRIPISEWAEQNYILESESAVGGGKFSFKHAPHLRLPLDLMGDDRFSEYSIWFASQAGKTTLTMVHMNYVIDIMPSNMMFFLPNDNLVPFTAQHRILPAIKRTKNKESLMVIKDEKKSKDNSKVVPFVGGVLRILGAASASNRKSMPAKYIYQDEIAEFEHKWVEEIGERAKTFEEYGGKNIRTSTSNHNKDPIVRGFRLSEAKFEYYVKCPKCGKDHIDDLLENVSYPGREEVEIPRHIEDDDDREAYYRSYASRAAVYLCPHCEAEWDTDTKNEAVLLGEWKVFSGNLEIAKSVGIRASSFVSTFVTIEKLVKKWLEVEGVEDKEEKFYNGWLSKVYKREDKGTQKSEILKLKSEIPRGQVPENTISLVSFTDVQKNHYFYIVAAMTQSLKIHIVDYGRLETEVDLERKIWQNYYDAEGTLHIKEADGVDAGYDSKHIYEFCDKMSRTDDLIGVDPTITEKFQQRYGVPLNAIPTKGSSRKMSTISQITNIESDIDGRKYKDSIKLHVINTEMFKDAAQKLIDRSIGGDLVLTLHEEAEESIAESLTSEIKKEFTDNKNRTKYEWVPKKSHPFNHYWDCLVGCLYLFEKNEVRFRQTQARQVVEDRQTAEEHHDDIIPDYLDEF